MNDPAERDIVDYFDRRIDCCAPRRDAAARPGGRLAAVLRQHLRSAGVAGLSVLELGCGRGELAAEVLADGAASIVGIDLAPENIAYANRWAADDGVEDRAAFRAGNAATDELPRTDVLIHHQVICCYPDASRFVANSLGADPAVYGFTMPRSRGIWGIVTRLALLAENTVHRVRRRGFRAYVHDERLVTDALATAGFRLHGRTNRLGWFTAVYVR